jgi:hypothetical protein
MIKNITGDYYGNIEELRGRKDPEAVKIVAKEMETLFAYEMIKAMRETTGPSSKDNLGGDTYMSMFDMELAKLFSERGIGLQDLLLKGLTRIAAKEGQAKEPADVNKNSSLSLSPPYNSPLPPQNAAEISACQGGGIGDSFLKGREFKPAVAEKKTAKKT